MKVYVYATDSGSGTIESESIDSAYDAIRGDITDAMVADGATLWVEDEDGNRLTMGSDRD